MFCVPTPYEALSPGSPLRAVLFLLNAYSWNNYSTQIFGRAKDMMFSSALYEMQLSASIKRQKYISLQYDRVFCCIAI
jgi:hypothetical protein